MPTPPKVVPAMQQQVSYPQVPSDYSKEAEVGEERSTRIRFESDGTGLYEVVSRIRVQAEAGVKDLAILTFDYTASNEQMDIDYVRVVKPDGTVIKTPDYNIQDLPADVTRSAPMYSDLHQKHVAVKGLGVGDVLEFKATRKTIKPEVPGQFWAEYTFEQNAILLKEQLELDLPADKDVTVNSSEAQPILSSSNGRKIYRWSSSNLHRPDPEAPTRSTRHWKPSVQVTSFHSWEEVGKWFQSLAQNSTTVTPALQAKADALTKGMTTDEEKVHALYNEVAQHIHYVGLEFGIGRYQPHAAEDVFSNEYGDCKDKHTLLAALLKAEGIEAWPVLISNGRELDEHTPSPAQFNHVITAVPLKGKTLWLDTTSEVAPMGMLIAQVRDKQGLVIPSTQTPHLDRTPINPPTPGFFEYSCTGQLDEQGHFTGHIKEVLHGDGEMIFRNAFRNTTETQWKELLQRILHGQGFGGEITAPKISPPEELDTAFSVEMDYSRDKYYQWKESENSHWVDAATPPMGGELAPGIKQIKPVDEVDLGALGRNVFNSSLTIPKDWTITLPPNVDIVEDWAEYHAQYSFRDGALYELRTMVIKKNRVPQVDWEKYLSFRRRLFADENALALIAPPVNKKQKHRW